MSKRRIKAGLPPGTLIHVGTARSHKPSMSVFTFSESSYQNETFTDTSACLEWMKNQTNVITWIDIDGLHNSEIIDKIGKHFSLHPLMLEDVMNTDQRPKSESYDNCIFLTLRMLKYESTSNAIEHEQVSLVLGKDYVISFQESPGGDVLGPVRERIRSGKGRVRKSGADYLFYAITDVIVDNYFSVIESIGENVERIEDEIFENPENVVLEEIQNLKKELIFLRRTVFPLREAIGKLEKEESNFISQNTLRFFRDVYDHIIHVIDSIESYRDIISGLKDIYISNISYKMNNVMKVLTVISTIFIPLTFIVGVYGMNFEHMPELHTKHGYLVTWICMLLIALGMMVYFRKKKWF